MILGAWRTGEPGVFFVDEANKYNPVPHLGRYEATNPCGEQPLLPYDVCNLGSINVGYYVRDGKMDWSAFRADIHLSTHFLDNIIDVNKYPLPEIDSLSKRIRRIGLGIMGFADALVKLGIAYDSDAGVEFGRKVMEFVDVEGKKESSRLAAERGPFPEWPKSIWGPDETCARDENGKRIRPMQLLRNCNVTTVAPTGTISIIAGCSSGLEPLFAVAFMRNQAGVMMPDVNEDFVAIAKAEGWYSDSLMERIAKEGRVDFPEVPATVAEGVRHGEPDRSGMAHQDAGGLPGVLRLGDQQDDELLARGHGRRRAQDLRARVRHELQGRHGLPRRQPRQPGAEHGRDGEGEGSARRRAHRGASEDRAAIADLKSAAAEKDAEIEKLKKQLYEVEAENLQRRAKRSRPDKLRGTTIRKETPLGVMFVNITEDEKGQPFEVFLTLGKAGGSAMADAEAMGRLISLALRSGIPMMEIHRQLRGISSDRAVGLGPHKVLSVPDAIGIAIEEWHRDRVTGVQQELMPPSVGCGAAVAEMVTSMTHQVPAALRPTWKRGGGDGVGVRATSSRRRRTSGRARIAGRRWSMRRGV